MTPRLKITYEKEIINNLMNKLNLKKQGDQYMEVPNYLKGTLTRKYYEEVNERKLTKGELKDRERIAQDLPDS